MSRLHGNLTTVKGPFYFLLTTIDLLMRPNVGQMRLTSKISDICLRRREHIDNFHYFLERLYLVKSSIQSKRYKLAHLDRWMDR